MNKATPGIPVANAPFQHCLAAAKRRLFLQQLLDRLALALALSTTILLLLLLAARLLTLATPLWLVTTLSALPLATAFFSLFFRRPTDADVAALIDRRLALQDRLTTGLYAQTLPDDAFARFAITDAQQAAQTADLARAFPLQIGRRWALTPALLVAALLCWFFAPQRDLLGIDARRKAAQEEQSQSEAAATEAGKAAEAAQELRRATQNDALAKEAQESLEQMAQLTQRDLSNPQLRKQAEAEISKAEDKLEKEAELKQQTFDTLDNSLSKIDSPAPGPADDFEDAMRRGDYSAAAKAMQQVSEAIGKMSPEDRKQLAEQMEEVAKQLEEAAAKFEKEQKESQEAARRELEKELEKQGVSRKEIEDLKREVAPPPPADNKQASNDAKQSEPEKAGEEKDKKETKEGKDGKAEQTAQTEEKKKEDAAGQKKEGEQSPGQGGQQAQKKEGDQKQQAQGEKKPAPTREQVQKKLEEKNVPSEKARELAEKMDSARRQQENCRDGQETAEQIAKSLKECASEARGEGKEGQSASANKPGEGQKPGTGQQPGGGAGSAQQKLEQLARMKESLNQMRQGNKALREAMRQMAQGNKGGSDDKPPAVGAGGGRNWGVGADGNPLGGERPPMENVTPDAVNAPTEPKGKVITSWDPNGKMSRGDAKLTYDQAVTSAKDQADKAIEEDRVPVKYRQAIKDYFNQVPTSPEGVTQPVKQ